MARWGMVIDLDQCTACQGCVVACAQENNLPIPTHSESSIGRSVKWIEMTTWTEGEYPSVKLKILPRPCMHCDDPPCVKVCPVGATFKSREGIVGQVYSRCIGCRYCTAACPYTARHFNWYKPDWPEPMERGRNPDVSIRPDGVVEKCSFCHHRLIAARDQAAFEGRPLRPGEYTPACVECCPARAMIFGDLDDPNSDVSVLARSRRAFTLLDKLGTKPKVIYLRERD
jgi:menaquinone reductase, iron-sulfur cluster-binding subunit